MQSQMQNILQYQRRKSQLLKDLKEILDEDQGHSEGS
jgi:hypothetical protein